jgi:hypothetical protein
MAKKAKRKGLLFFSFPSRMKEAAIVSVDVYGAENVSEAIDFPKEREIRTKHRC